jgi:hypothetical protein
LLEVTKDGYTPVNKSIPVAAGEDVREDTITLTPLPKNPGILEMKSNLAGFKVTVDGIARGDFPNTEGSLKLEEGSHTVQYSNADNSYSGPKHTIQITAGKPTLDPVTIKETLPATGSLVVVTNPNASVKVDGGPPLIADAQSGQVHVDSLPVGPHRVDITLDDHQAANNLPVSIEKGQQYLLSKLLDRNRVTTGSLSIHTTSGAQVTVSGPGGFHNNPTVDPSGIANLQGLQPGDYTIEIKKSDYVTQNRSINIQAGQAKDVLAELPHNSASVVNPTPTPTPTPPPVVVDHTADFNGISFAVNAFQAAFRSKNLGQLQAAWLDAAGAKNLFSTLSIANYVEMTASCKGKPDIGADGNTATQNCDENTRYDKGDPLRHNPYTYTFVKRAGGQWVLEKRTSQK